MARKASLLALPSDRMVIASLTVVRNADPARVCAIIEVSIMRFTHFLRTFDSGTHKYRPPPTLAQSRFYTDQAAEQQYVQLR